MPGVCDDCRHRENDACDGDGHIDCDSCRGTAIGQDHEAGTCGSCKGRGWTQCDEVADEPDYDFERKRRIEDKLLEAMED